MSEVFHTSKTGTLTGEAAALEKRIRELEQQMEKLEWVAEAAWELISQPAHSDDEVPLREALAVAGYGETDG